MRKIILFLSFLILFSGFQTNNIVFSARYNNHPVAYIWPSSTSCDDDLDGIDDSSYIRVAEDNNSTTIIPETGVFTVPSNGTMRCLYWDGQNPTVSANNTSIWVQDTNITLSVSDTGGSGIDYARYRWNNSDCVSGTDFSNGTIINTNALSEGINTLYLCVSDNVGYTASWNGDYWIDRTAPLPSDVSSVTTFDLLAKDNQSINISVSNAGASPIVEIKGTFEDYSKCDNSFLGEEIFNTGSIITTKSIEEVKVSCDFNSGFGGREYTYNINYIEDEAGNIYNGSIDQIYRVYSDSQNITTKSVNVGDLISGNLIADGQTNTMEATLKDNWGNEIVPASGINRKINFNFDDVVNTLYLNQYLQSGGSAVELNTDINDMSSSDGIYSFDFNVYTPTQNNYSKASGNFQINDITFEVEGTLGMTGYQSLTGSFPIEFSFKPIYELTINGDLKDNGFVEGATQTGTIDLIQNGTEITTDNNLYIEFGSGTLNNISDKVNMQSNLFSGYGYIGEGNNVFDSDNLFMENFGVGSYALNTLLTLDGGLLNDILNSYFSTHVSYTIDGKNVVYNTDIVGKTNYWGNLNNSFDLLGLKIIGKTHSQDQVDIVEGQDDSDIHLLGNIDKTELKADLRKNVFEITKLISNTGGGDISYLNEYFGTDGTNYVGKLLNENTLYFGDLGGTDVELDLQNLNKYITGQKTVIIVGGNLYIKSNINNETSSDILGIIVLKNDNDQGGNIYVDPSVTKIDAIMYADYSLISYDGTQELDGSTTQYVLRNQLYIYGSLFSENTIGASRDIPPICPYYVKLTCDLETAQKYDLNYIRRYFVNAGVPLNGGVNYFNDYDGGLGYLYYNYPIVIEYNPMVQLTPPPLFGD